MKKPKRIIFIIMAVIVLLLGSFLGYAYYEYYGQYSSVLNIDGTIKVDAFDCLYPSIRNSANGYGTTPENPYVIDNETRLQNLIKLNNSGKLKKSKNKVGVDKYYFCLQFDGQTQEQILNLANSGSLNSIGNNSYPFEDELSGIVYASEITSGNLVYYSGCLPTVYYDGTDVLINGTANSDYSVSNGILYYNGSSLDLTIVENTTYILTSKTYDSSSFVATDETSVVFTSESALIAVSDTTTIHQIIANATISADLEQVDVGFISEITSGGYVHDLILYNTTIECHEEIKGGLYYSLYNLISSLVNHETSSVTHYSSVTPATLGLYTLSDETYTLSESNSWSAGETYYKLSASTYTVVTPATLGLYTYSNSEYILSESNTWESISYYNSCGKEDRHIGIFAGHISAGGSAANISVAGESNINIDTEEVSYYSNYTTVGYIDNDAYIGGIKFSQIASEATGDGDVTGVLFADEIYELAVADGASSSTGNDNETHYILTDISAADGWPGTDGISFKYGSFTFMLSAADDTISTIWADSSELYLLNQEGYTITGSALYCADEYRYSADTQSGSGVNTNAASLKETVYSGVSSLDSTGNVIDAGKYIIVAKVGSSYYALKMVAETDGTNTTYTFDTTSSIDVTEFINGTGTLYQSALWEVKTASSTPVFINSRFSTTNTNYYLTQLDNTDVSCSTTTSQEFSYDIVNSVFYYDYTDSDGSVTRYYLNFDASTYSFYFETTPESNIEMYQVSSGYELEEISSASDVDDNGLYLIVSYYNGNYYLLGTNTDGETVYQEFAADILLSTATAYTNSFTTTMTTDQFTTYANYIWRANLNGSTISFVDKLSSSYYLSNDGSSVILTTNQVYWTYNSHNLYYNGRYLNSSYNASATSTCFTVTTGAGSNIYLLEITPEDDTPPYISYDGAKYVDADASTITCGDYVLVAEYNGNTYAIGLSSSTVVAATSVNVSNYTLGNSYVWSITDGTSTTTSSLLLKNNSYTSYYLYGSTSAVSGSQTARTWYYDAINHYVYFITNNITYYLTYNGSSIVISTTPSTNIYLYEYQAQYTYNNVTRITTDAGFYNQTSAYFLISTLDLHDTSLAPYLVGTSSSTTADSSNQSDVQYYSMQGNYTVSAPTSGTESSDLFNLTTTSDLSYYRWKLAGYATYSSYYYSYYYSIIYNDGYESVGYNHKFLTANNVTSNRQLATYLSSTWNVAYGSAYNDLMNFGYTKQSSLPANGMNIAENGTTTFSFRGSGANYGMFLGDDNKSVKLIGKGGSTTISNPGTSIYFYYCNSITTNYILSLVSADGDTLEQDIHYAIAAKSGNSYYAMTYDEENASSGITGTDMTQQINLIIAAGDNGYNNLTTIPSNCDFEQVSNDYNLRFKHYNSSTSSSYNYLDYTNSSNHYITTQSNSTSYENINAMYYDIINKILSYSYNNITYYITYDEVNNVFGTSTSKLDAAEIILIRYTPSYTVTLVTDLTAEDLSSGQYIIAGHSVDGYTALGSSVSTLNITEYLSSVMSEEDYNSLISYIWDQVYYDYNYTYDSDIAANYVQFMLSNADTGTGIHAYSNGTTNYWGSYSSSSTWTFTVNSSGVWTLKCAIGVGTDYYAYFTASGYTSSLTMTDTYEKIEYYISNQSSVTTEEESGTQVVLYDYANGVYTEASSIEAGKQYVIFIKSGSYYYLVSYTNNTYTTTSVGKNLTGVASKIGNSGCTNYLLTATAGTYGYALQFDSTGYYLYSNGSTIGVYSQASTYWDYYYNDSYKNKSRLYTVTSGTISGAHLDISGSKVITSTSTDTYLYTVSGSSGSYTLGSIATSVSTSSKYAIVIFKNGLYYLVSNDGLNNVTYVSYNGSLPTTLSDEEVWNVLSGYHFYQTVGSTTYYITMGGDSALSLSTEYGNSYFSYNGSASSTAASYSANAYSSGAGMYLFKVEKNDELDSSSDVTVTLTGKTKVSASLSVNTTSEYIIVGMDDDGNYYVLSMADTTTIKALDISEEFEDALNNGDDIKIYDAAIWTQLGSDYSMILSNLGFSGSFYYLLNGTYSSRNGESPVITEYSLYNENATYYTIVATVEESFESGTVYYILDENKCYIKQYNITSFESGTVYYSLTVTELEEGSEFESGKRYYTFSGSDTLASPYTYTPVTSGTISDEEQYTWTIYQYATTGGTGYVIGYYDAGYDNVSYLYFDSSTRTFKLTNDISVAKENQVQIYALGAEALNQDTYQTFNIYMDEDNVTIASFPLNDTDYADVTVYDSQNTTSQVAESGATVEDVVPGEYLICAKSNGYYYALSVTSEGMTYSDISLYFSGNFSKDTYGYYCISMNTKYLFKQVSTVSYEDETGYPNNLIFKNFASSYNLSYSYGYESFTYDGENIYIVINGTTYYLTFTDGEGFSFSTTKPTSCDIILYSVGSITDAISEESALSYTYYSSGLDTAVINYSYFTFNTFLLKDLPNYANEYGLYEYTNGWYLSSGDVLEDINSSVYFEDGISTSTMTELTYNYTYTSESNTTENTVTYYAPNGTASFVVTEATDDSPIYVNIVVSTELADSTDTTLRYLALWQMATIDASTGTTTTYYSDSTGSYTSSDAYLATFNTLRYTPYAAIPLPNHYDSSTAITSSSLVKTDTGTYYLSNYGYDHLIAHTFVITTPGVYYLGSTSGTVAICYLSIDSMVSAIPSEDSSDNLSEDFTIDFVSGSISTTSYAFGTDSNVGSIAYVGRTDSDYTWTHSNVYPGFTNATSGLIDADSSATYYTLEATEFCGFVDGITYYTYDSDTGSYSVVSANAKFNKNNDYYILSGSSYVLAFSNSTTYYTVNVDEGGNVYFRPVTSNTLTEGKTYYILTATTVTGLSSFSHDTVYYTLSGTTYTQVFNPFDYLDMTIIRTVDSNGVSTVSITYSTYTRIYNYGYGITYIKTSKSSLYNVVVNHTNVTEEAYSD